MHNANGQSLSFPTGGVPFTLAGRDEEPKEVIDVEAPGFNLKIDRSQSTSIVLLWERHHG